MDSGFVTYRKNKAEGELLVDDSTDGNTGNAELLEKGNSLLQAIIKTKSEKGWFIEYAVNVRTGCPVHS